MTIKQILGFLVVVAVGFVLLCVTGVIKFQNYPKGFDVHIGEMQEAATNAQGTITQTGKESVMLQVAFISVSDEYKFDMEIVNSGTYDAIINNFELSGKEKYTDNLEFTIADENGDDFGQNVELKQGETKKVTITIRPKENAEIIDLQDSTINLKYNLSVNK